MEYKEKLKEALMPLVFETLRIKGGMGVEQLIKRDYNLAKKEYATAVYDKSKSIQERLEMSREEIAEAKKAVWKDVELIEDTLIKIILNKLLD